MVYHAVLKHQAVCALSRLKTRGGHKKALEDNISVMAIFDKEHTKKDNSKDDSDEDDFFTYCQV